MKLPRPKKSLKTAHTSNSQKGMGDNYGQGVRNKVGRPIDIMGMTPVNAKNRNKPPKSLA